MNLSFLGDALDHWKGSIFESLQQSGVTQDLAVDPMATDLSDWTEEDFEHFSRLLRVRQAQLIRHSVSLNDRSAYFEEIQHQGGLFMDPDTGIRTGQVKHPERYIEPAEINRLFDAASGRLVIVYQHVRAQPVRDRVASVLAALKKSIGHLNACSYESGTVAMLFLSRQDDRTDEVAAHFEATLGRHAERRIHKGKPSLLNHG